MGAIAPATKTFWGDALNITFKGWDRAGKWLPKKPKFFGLLKNLKTSKVQNLGFFLFCGQIFYRYKFHILIVICEFCSSWVENFMSGLLSVIKLSSYKCQ